MNAEMVSLIGNENFATLGNELELNSLKVNLLMIFESGFLEIKLK
jgi:hypothetical protein